MVVLNEEWSGQPVQCILYWETHLIYFGGLCVSPCSPPGSSRDYYKELEMYKYDSLKGLDPITVTASDKLIFTRLRDCPNVLSYIISEWLGLELWVKNLNMCT